MPEYLEDAAAAKQSVLFAKSGTDV